ncbi:MAG: hypothetical protein FJY67_10155 [Calditrichaeota bacterium]|nr:hypothetical protein [Calditrichota bacterium]
MITNIKSLQLAGVLLAQISWIATEVALAFPGIETIRLIDQQGSYETLWDLFCKGDRGHYACGQTSTGAWALSLDSNLESVWAVSFESGTFLTVIETDDGDALVGGDQDGFSAALLSAENGEIIWETTYAAGRCYAVIELKAGQFILAGESNGNGYMMMIEEDGNEIWELVSERRNQVRRRIRAIREVEDGIVAVADDNPEGALIKVSFEGEVLWERQIVDDSTRFLELPSMTTRPGGFAIGGYGYARQGRSDRYVCLIQTNLDGLDQSLNVIPSGRNINDYCYGMSRFRDGGFILAGLTWDIRNNPASYYLLMNRTNRSGELRWQTRFPDLEFPPMTQSIFWSVIVDPENRVVACGTRFNPESRQNDAIIMRLNPDQLGPRVIDFSPPETDLVVLRRDSISFEVHANARNGLLGIQWFLDNVELQDDSSQVVRFEDLGLFQVRCQLEDADGGLLIIWNVTVSNLIIFSHTPDTLSLTIQRNSEIDFALDSVAYIGDLENLLYEWMIYDSAAVRWEEVAGDDRIGIRSYAFNRTGGYALKARVFDPNVDPVPADSVQWAIQVRGVIRAYEPNLPELSLEPRQEATFELIPFNANNDSIEFWWSLDGEEDTLSIESILSISFSDTGRYVVSGYARERVSEEDWEEDVQRWVVNVGMLSVDDFGLDSGFRRNDDPLMISIAPNPFNDQATVTIELGGRAFLPALRADKNVRPPRAQVGGLMPVRIGLYAIDGREVLRLHDGQLSPGSHTFALSHFGTFTLPSGIYFLRLQAGTKSLAVKAVMMR